MSHRQRNYTVDTTHVITARQSTAITISHIQTILLQYVHYVYNYTVYIQYVYV